MRTVFVALATVFACTAGLLAQWPPVRSASAPRTADGRINMDAPSPRAADGHVDFTGVWDRGLLPGEVPRPGGFLASGPSQAFRDLKAAVPDLPMLPWAAALKASRFAENSKDHPDAHCLPIHPIQMHMHPQPRRIVQTRDVLLLIYEANDGRREIFLDGRPLPAGDVQPFWFGYSVGRWDGDTLIVESLGFKDQSWLDEYGTPGSDQLKIVERFRRPNFGTLVVDITVTDPKTFSRPFSFTLQQRLMPETDLIEFVCAENNRPAAHLVGK